MFVGQHVRYWFLQTNIVGVPFATHKSRVLCFEEYVLLLNGKYENDVFSHRHIFVILARISASHFLGSIAYRQLSLLFVRVSRRIVLRGLAL